MMILYEMLRKREYFISHSHMPSYKDHVDFVKNNPYRLWYLIRLRSEYIGNFYIQYDNSVGLNLMAPEKYLLQDIFQFILSKFKPEPAIASLIRKDFFINLPIEDRNMVNLVKELGFQEKSISFELGVRGENGN